MHARCVLISSILIIVAFCPNLSANENQYFDPIDIELSDLGYNLTNKISAQWWYFDAVFSNNYSTVVGIFHLGIAGKIGFFFIRINMYKNGQFLERCYKIIPQRQITFSLETPELTYKNSNIYSGTYDSNEKILVHLNITIVNTCINLKFSELTKGWKGYTGRGWWSCPLPKAQVNGSIKIHNKTMQVNGIGYHEHAWMVQSMHRNWKWGKFSSDTTNTIFSKNMKNLREEDIFLVVINTDAHNFISIHRDNLSYSHVDYMFDHGKFIPIKSVLEINQEPIHLNVTFQAESVHFTSLILLNYWRFHMQIKGNITINDKSEEINDHQIMEYLYIL